MIITKYQPLLYIQGDEAIPYIKMIDDIGEAGTLKYLLDIASLLDKAPVLDKSPIGFKDHIYTNNCLL